MGIDMKDAEDEAFDDLERRQGGFQAKRQMAADKLQDETDMLTIAYLHGYDKGKKAALAQPAQEPVAWQWLGSAHFRKKIPKNADITAWNPVYSAPQRPWAGLTYEEIKQCGFAVPFDGTKNWALRFVKAAEAKLKEKNG